MKIIEIPDAAYEVLLGLSSEVQGDTNSERVRHVLIDIIMSEHRKTMGKVQPTIEENVNTILTYEHWYNTNHGDDELRVIC